MAQVRFLSAHALSELLAELLAWASGRLPRRARHRADTGDIVQQVFLEAIPRLRLDLFRSVPAIRHYLRKAVRSRIIDEIRRSAVAEITSLPSANLVDASSSASPLQHAQNAEHRRRYRRALASLDKDSQILIVGRVDLELSYSRLAIATGRKNADAARIATRRALLRLARALGPRRPLEIGGAQKARPA